jgi:Ca-activated chloride channel family protein
MTIPGIPNFQILHPLWLLLLVLAPLFAILRGSRHGRRPAIKFPATSLLRDLGRPARSGVGGFIFGLVLISFVFGVAALSRPQKVLSYDEEKAEGISIMLTVDVSLSMLIEDIYIGGQPVNRLTAAKRVMADFIKGAQVRPHRHRGVRG